MNNPLASKYGTHWNFFVKGCYVYFLAAFLNFVELFTNGVALY